MAQKSNGPSAQEKSKRANASLLNQRGGVSNSAITLPEDHSSQRALFENRIVDLLEIGEVAEVLGKSPQTIRNWIARREIPFVRVGNRNMVLKASLEAWLKSKEFRPWP